MTSDLYSIEAITTDDGIPRLREAWDYLSFKADRPNVFTTFSWFQAWYECLTRQEPLGERRPNILVLKKKETVTGISPLIRTVPSRFGFSIRRLQFLTCGSEWDYNDLVVGNDVDEEVEAIVDFLKDTSKEWDLIDLRHLRDMGKKILPIKGALTRAGLPFRLFPETERCPYMPIDGPWSDIISRRSSATRHSFRNRQSRLKKLAGDGLRVRIIENPLEEPFLLEKMIMLEAQKSVGGKPSEPFLGLYSDVFASVFKNMGLQGRLSIVVMELGDRLLAWHLLFRCGQKLWGYLTAYDHRFSHLSPGTMLIPAIVDYGFSHGYTEYDFLSGEEPYKMQWTSGFHDTYRLLIWNRRWVSRLGAKAYLKFRVPEWMSHQHDLGESLNCESKGFSSGPISRIAGTDACS